MMHNGFVTRTSAVRMVDPMSRRADVPSLRAADQAHPGRIRSASTAVSNACEPVLSAGVLGWWCRSHWHDSHGLEELVGQVARGVIIASCPVANSRNCHSRLAGTRGIIVSQ